MLGQAPGTVNQRTFAKPDTEGAKPRAGVFEKPLLSEAFSAISEAERHT
jgi:hypothetical protein